MEFRKIDRSNYWECMELTVDDSQKDFVADNKQSLVEAAYEENLYTLGIYCQDTMVGFILYDYDDQIPRLVDEPLYDWQTVPGKRIWQTGGAGISG